MKIKSLAASATAFLHLKGPDGVHLYDDTTPIGIDLFGPGSAEAAIIESAQTERAYKRMRDNDNKPTLPSVEEQRVENLSDLVAYTVEFRGIEYEDADGKPLHGKALFAAVYSDPSLGWIKSQVMKFCGDWSNFKPASGGS